MSPEQTPSPILSDDPSVGTSMPGGDINIRPATAVQSTGSLAPTPQSQPAFENNPYAGELEGKMEYMGEEAYVAPSRIQVLSVLYRTHLRMIVILSLIIVLVGSALGFAITKVANRDQANQVINSVDTPQLPGQQVTNVTNNLLTVNSALKVVGQTSLSDLQVSKSATIGGALKSDSVTTNDLTVAGSAVVGGALQAGSVSGNGSGLTAVNADSLAGNPLAYFQDASHLTSGTVSDSRLSTNIARLNADNTFTGNNNFADVSVAGQLNLQGALNGQSANFAGSLAANSITQNGFAVCDTSGNCGGSSANSFVQGGNAFGATATLGTTDANDLNIITNGITRLSVSSAGNLTISGAVTAASFSGNGSGLSSVNAAQLGGQTPGYYTNASNLSSGTVGAAFGGTGVNGAAAGNGKLLIGNGSGYTLANIAQGSGISITNGAGAITIGVDNTVCTTAGNCSGLGGGVTTTGGTTGTVALFTGTQAIGDSIISQSGSIISVAGTLAATALQGDGSAITNLNASNLSSGTVASARIAGNYTGITAVGALTGGSIGGSFGAINTTNAISTTAALQGNSLSIGSGSFTVDATGAVTAATGITSSGNIIFSSLNTGGIVTADGTGKLSAGTIDIGTGTTGDYVAHLGTLTGLTTTGNSGNGSTPTISVTYGAAANTAAQGSTALSFTGSGNLTGTVTGTAGGGFTGNTLAIVNNPTFTGLLSANGGLSATTASFSSTVTLSSLGAGIVQTDGGGVVTSGAIDRNSSNLTGQTNVGNGGTGATTAAGARTNLGAAASGANSDITSLSAATSVGATGQALTLQGNASTVLNATDSGFTTSVGFASPTANVSYLFQTAAAGTYDICTTAGNCTGVGGSVTTPGGTAGTIALFTGSNSIANSLLSQVGTTVTVAGTLSATALQGSGAAITNLNGTNITSGTVGVSVGGTGAGSFTSNGVIYGNGTGALQVTAAGQNGECLVGNTGSAPSWVSCATASAGPAGGDLSGTYPNPTVVGIYNTPLQITSLASANILIYDGTNWVNAAVSGDITVSSSGVATIANGAVTNAKLANSAVTVTAGTGLTGGGSVSLGAATTLNVAYGSSTGTAVEGNKTLVCTAGTGNLTGGGNTVTLGSGGSCGSLNVVTNPSFNSLTLATALSIANGGTGDTTAAGARTNLGAAASGANSDITSLSTVTSINNSAAALSVGNTGKALTLQGNASTILSATDSGFTTSVGFAAPTSNVNYLFQTAAAGTYDICTTAGNCSGVGGGVTTAGGTTGTIALFTGSSTIGNSILSQSGTTITVGGTLSATALQGSGAAITNLNGTNIASGTVGVSVGGTGAGSFTSDGIIYGNGTGALQVTAAGQTGECLVGNTGSAPTWVSCTSAGSGGTPGGPAGGDLSGTYPNPSVVGLYGTPLSISSLTTANVLIYNGTNWVNAAVSGDITVGASGIATIANGAVTNAKLANSAVTVTAGTGLTGGGSVSLGAATTLNVSYGSLASTAVEGNKTLVCTAGTGNLTGGGNTITLGAGGTCGTLNVVTNPSFNSLTLATALTIANGGTGSTTAAGALTNLGAAASGANSDITSITGLTTALSAGQGGTGVNGATAANGKLLIGNGSGYTLANLTQGSGISITNGAGAITIGVDSTVCTTAGNCAGSGGGVTTAGGTTGTIALFTGSQAIGDSIISQSGTVVSVAGTLAATTLQGNTLTIGSGTFTVNGTGAITAATGITSSGTINFSSLNTAGVVHTNGSGTLSTGKVALASETTGNYVATLGTLTGLSTTGNTGNGSTPTLSVTYGAAASTAAQGNTAISFTGSGNLTGTVSGTAGGGISSNTLALVNNPTFSGLLSAAGVSVTGANALTVGATGSAQFSFLGVGLVKSDASGNLSSGTADRNSASYFVNALNAANGGTGINGASAANGSLLIGNGTGYTLATLTAGSGITITNGSGSIGVAVDSTVCTTAGNCAGVGGGVTTAGGTANYVARFTGSSAIGNGLLYDTGVYGGYNISSQLNGASFGVQAAASSVGLAVKGSGTDIADFLNSGATLVATIDSSGAFHSNAGVYAPRFDTDAAATLLIGPSNATEIDFGKYGVDSVFKSDVYIPSGTLRTTNIQGQTGVLNLGTDATATPSVTIGHFGTTATVAGTLVVVDGANIVHGLTVSGISSTIATFKDNGGSTTVATLDNSGVFTSNGLVAPSLDSAGSTLTIAGTSASTVNIANNNANHTVNIAASGSSTQAVNIGSSGGSSSIFLQSGDGGISANSNSSSSGGYNFAVQGTGVQSIDFAGRTVFKPLTNIASAFTVKDASNNNLLIVNADTKDVVINGAGGLSVLQGGISTVGALTFTGTGTTNFVTPLGTSVATKINIPLYDPGSFNQIISLGVPSTANVNSRVISLFDARPGAHQPTLAVFNPAETSALGFSYEGSNTIGYVKSLGSSDTIGLRLDTVDAATFSATAIALNANTTLTGTFSGSSTINASTGFKFNGTAGSTTTCSSGNVLQNAVIQGGIITGGTCVANGGGVAPTLQNVYDNSAATDPQIQLTTGSGGLKVRDASTTVGNIFQIQNSAGSTTYLAVTNAGTSVTGTLGVSGLTTLSGSLVAYGTTSTFTPGGGTSSAVFQGAGTSTGLLQLNVNSSTLEALSIGSSGSEHFSVMGSGDAYGSSFNSDYFDSANTTLNIGTTKQNIVNLGRTGMTGAFNLQGGTAGVNIATAGIANTVQIGNTSGAVAQTINLGNNATASSSTTVNIGSTVGASTTNIKAGTGGINLNAAQTTVGSTGTATGQFYVSGAVPTSVTGSTTLTGAIDTAVQGRYMYTVNYTNLTITDISNPASPVNKGSATSNVGSGAKAVAVAGRYAYVAESNGTNKLEVFDISNPNAPASVGTVTLPASVNDVAVSGRYAYLSVGNTMQVVDISNPASPVLLGSASVSSGTGAQAIAAQGRYVYMTTYNTSYTLQVFDVSNPSSPTQVGAVTVGTSPGALAVNGRYAYVGHYSGNSVKIVDISNPASPSVTGTLSYASHVNTVAVADRYLYVGLSGGGLSVADVSNPASPSTVGTYAGSISPTSLAISGRYAYAADYNSNKVGTFDLGGTYSQQLEVGNIETTTLSVTSDATFAGGISIQGSLQIGQSLQVSSDFGLGGSFSSVGSITSASTINAAAGFKFNGTAGSTTTCGAGTTLDSAVIQGGIVTGGTCVAYAAATGAAGYIQNQTAGAQTTSNFWISGTGRADTAIVTPAIRPTADGTSAFQIQNAAGTATVMNVDTTNSIIQIKGSAADDNATIGAELFGSGSFSASTGWTAISGTGASATATHTNGGGTTALATTGFTPTIGVIYLLTYTVSGGSAGNSVTPQLGCVGGLANYNTSGTDYQVFTATGACTLAFVPSNTWAGTVTGVSIKQITKTKATLQVLTSSGAVSLEVRSTAAANSLFIGTNSGGNNTSTGIQNTALGVNSLQNNTSGTSNIAIGYQSLQSNTVGTGNVAIGTFSLQKNTVGQSNTGVGYNSLQNNTSGQGSTAVGYNSLQNNTVGTFNTAIGYSSLQANTSGVSNTGVGYNSLQNNTTGQYNTAIGYSSLQANTVGQLNVAIGFNALIAAGAGYSNVAIGPNSLQSTTIGQNNTAIGQNSLGSNISGYGNTGVGNGAGYQETNGHFKTGTALQNSTAIGAYAQVQADNTIVLGSVDTATQIVIGATKGIGTNSFGVSPIDYQVGQVTRTNSSATLIGTGTTWTSAMVGDVIIFADGTSNTITAFTDATHITMGTTYAGTTDASPVYYRFHKVGFQVTNAGTAYVRAASTTAFQVQNASSGASVFNVDTTTNRVSVGSLATSTAQLYVSGVLPSASASSISTANGAYYSKVVGKYAYVAVIGGMNIYDLTTPTSPVLAGSVSLAYNMSGVEVVGKYAYVSNYNSSRLYTVDISNPNSPTSLGFISSGTGGPVHASGRYLYNDDGSTLRIYDLVNPAVPVQVGSIAIASGQGGDFAVNGRYVYLTDGGPNYLRIFDVSNPSSISQTGFVGTDNTPDAVAVSGKYAYVVNNFSGSLQAINISNPASPSVTTTVATGTNPVSVNVQGRLVYVVNNGSSTLQLFDISTPGTPSSLGSVATASKPTTVAVQGRYAYVTTDASDPVGTLDSFDMGGAYLQQLQTGSAELGSLTVTGPTNLAGDTNLQGGLAVGGSAIVDGNFAVGGSVKLQNTANSTTAFQIQNATSVNLFTADTTNMQVIIGTATNNVTLSANGIVLNGTARNAKSIFLPAEYTGAVLDTGLTGNNTGTMTSGIDLTARMNYYKWTTTSGTNQSYDIDVQVPIPKDFSAWASGTPLSITTYSSDLTNGKIYIEAIDTGGTTETGCKFATPTSVTPGTINTWATNSSSCAIAGTYTAGSYMTLRIRLNSPASGDVRVGNIVLNYLSKY